MDAGRLGCFASVKSAVDVEVGIADNRVLFVRRRGVVALVGNDSTYVMTLAKADGYLLAGKRTLGHAAKTFETQKAVGFDLADHEAELIHVGEQKYARPAALKCGPKIAQPVTGAGQRSQVMGNSPPHAIFVPRKAGN